MSYLTQHYSPAAGFLVRASPHQLAQTTLNPKLPVPAAAAQWDFHPFYE